MSVTRQVTRGAALRAVILVFIGATGVQLSAAIALGMFDSLGVLSTSSLRLLIAAVALLLIFRPRLRGRSGREWAAIVLYGFAMASMNIFLYLAIDRIPLGIATTIDFLGPCLVALLASRRLGEVVLAFVAFGGVALIAGLGGPIDALGLVFAGCAAVCMGLYTLLAARVGQSSGGLPSVALSVAFAALITLPLSVPTVPEVSAPQWGMLLLSALLGTALAFTVDTMAGRWTSARVIGVLFAFDPLVGTLVGALLLGQVLTAPALLGIGLVVAAGAGIVWMAGRGGPAADTGERIIVSDAAGGSG